MANAKYNHQHTKTRAAALAAMQDGDLCHLCGQPMWHYGNDTHLHLDHDLDGTTYRGLTHAHCNTVDGARRGGQATTRKRRGLNNPEINGGYRASRNW